ncbi:MAG: hypothetical protein MJ105_05895 [Lachnospiraceae bacterium]|nr:hypothetical protein [Lachnospiraceae bacterium]
MKKKYVVLLLTCVFVGSSMSACGKTEIPEMVQEEVVEENIPEKQQEQEEPEIEEVEEEEQVVEEIPDAGEEYEISSVSRMGDGFCWAYADELGRVLMSVEGDYICSITGDIRDVGEIANGITYYTVEKENDYKEVYDLHVLNTKGEEVYFADDVDYVLSDDDGNIIYAKTEADYSSSSCKTYLLHSKDQSVDSLEIETSYDNNLEAYRITEGVYVLMWWYLDFNRNIAFQFDHEAKLADDNYIYVDVAGINLHSRIDKKSLENISTKDEFDALVNANANDLYNFQYISDKHYVGNYYNDNGTSDILDMNDNVIFAFDEYMQDLDYASTGEYLGVTFMGADYRGYVTIYDMDFNVVLEPLAVSEEGGMCSIQPVGKEHFLVDSSIVGIDGKVYEVTDDKSSLVSEYANLDHHRWILENGYLLVSGRLYDVSGNQVKKVLKK